MSAYRRQYEPLSDRLETWERPRTRIWQTIAGVLALIYFTVGPVDLEALDARIALEEEGAQRASAGRDPIPPALFADDPRELHQLELGWPLRCLAPEAQWIRQWGDGRTPYEAHPVTGRRPLECVDADLRRPHVE